VFAVTLCFTAFAAEKEPHPAIFAEFQKWTERYLEASMPDIRSELEKEGQTLAAERRVLMTNLIQSVPQRALEFAMSSPLRRQLPASIARHLEQRISGRGDLTVLVMDDFARGKSETQRTVALNGRIYRAFVYGRRTNEVSRQNIPLHGIVLDDLMAVHESPLRVLTRAETVDPKTPLANPDMLCPVCQKPASQEIAAEVAGAVYYLDRPEHIPLFEQRIR
jgi:hypothetical protein